MHALDRSYAKSILLRLYENGSIGKKSDLSDIASNWRTVSDVLESLATEGYLSIKEERIGRRVFRIELTKDGLAVAKKLEEIEGIMKR